MQTKIFSENAAWDWITACSRELDWNLKQEDKIQWKKETNEKLLKKSMTQNRITVCDSRFDQNLKHKNEISQTKK